MTTAARRSPALSRRVLLRAGALGALVAAGTAVYRLATARPRPTLLAQGLALGPDGVVHTLGPSAVVRYEPGTRVPLDSTTTGLTQAQRSELVERFRARRTAARLPAGRWAALADDALADLLALTGPSLERTGQPHNPIRFPAGAVVAAPVAFWHYVWPRDASFAAAALSAVGLTDEALGVLAHLASLQGEGGGFAARYTYLGAVPDDRPSQSDGVGWVMWATGRLLADGVGATAINAALGATPARATTALLDLTDTPSHLPAASPDYWEVPERVLTLGTAAPVLLGLEAALALAAAGVDVGPGRAVLEDRIGTVRAAVERAFAPGWGRHVGGDDVDAAIVFVAPPFTAALDGVEAVRAGAAARMRRPAGGVAPGESWRQDGVSWTPETALLAWSAASAGDRDEAEDLLDWLEAHRTGAGALPEKVDELGSPVGPAPLAWTCAVVLLALCEADRAQ